LDQVVVQEVQTYADYDLAFVTIFEVRHADEEPEFLVTWDKQDLAKRQGVRGALLDALSPLTNRSTSSICQKLPFKEDNAPQSTHTVLANMIAAGRRKGNWQGFTEKLAQRYKEQKGFREGAMLFALYSFQRRLYVAILRVDFEKEALQIVREKREMQLAGDVFLPEESLRKCIIYPYRSRETGKPDTEYALVLQRDSWAHYFVDFASLEWYPSAADLAAELNAELAGNETRLGDVVSRLVPRIRKTFKNTGGATTKNMIVQIDGVSIQLSYGDIEGRKVVFCNFRDKVVGLVMGSRFILRYGGSALNAKVRLETVNNLNALVPQD
jgi:hypothetical protein